MVEVEAVTQGLRLGILASRWLRGAVPAELESQARREQEGARNRYKPIG